MSTLGQSPVPPQPPSQPPSQPPRRSSLWPGVMIGVLVFALIAAGAFAVVRIRDAEDKGSPSSDGSISPQPAPTAAMPSTDPDLAKFYDQKLQWQSCNSGDQCTRLTVPLDYKKPDGDTIRLAVLKAPASGKRIASLVVNPGGPGGSGIEYAAGGAQVWPAPLREHFDIVGFDPRGVGESDPLECMDTEQSDTFVDQDPEPDDAAERQQYVSLIQGFAKDCQDKDAGIAAHMSTQEVVRDVDILRQALGESKLSYFGASYGTTIGSQYANLFPTHVQRMVLDGAVDQGLSAEQLNLGQAGGFETAWRAYAEDCVSKGDCPLGDSVDAASQRIRQFFDEVDQNPLPGSGDRQLTAGTAVNGVFLPLYVKQYWPILTSALRSALDDGDGAQLLTLSDLLVGRGPSEYKDNSLQALVAVNCLDSPGGSTVDGVQQYVPEFLKASPTFGDIFAYSVATCHYWPFQPEYEQGRVTAKGAPPIVVVGTTRDPATPYSWAVDLAKQLDSGVLVSRDGDGHTGFNMGNDCVDSAVEDYLVEAKVPKDGTTC